MVLGNASHEKLPKTAHDKLFYGTFGAERTYRGTVVHSITVHIKREL